MRQLGFKFRTWGGERKGAGRKPKGAKAGVAHVRRGSVGKAPVHVTVRMLPHVWNLRSNRSWAVIQRALLAGAERWGMRLCKFSVQGNHLHLIVEGPSLGQAMKALGVRVARGLNKMMGRKGRVWADRYHAHVLRTPTEVRNAVHYVVNNYQKHHGPIVGPDYYSSASRENGVILPPARTWPLKTL